MKQRLRESFATLLVYGIKADNVISEKEKELFCKLMEENFDVEYPESVAFLANSNPTPEDIEKHTQIINEFSKNNPMQKMHILECLNHIIYSDGIELNEYTVFEKLKNCLFPNID
jgi:uncharacterized tellurite resistance protein B-like protein